MTYYFASQGGLALVQIKDEWKLQEGVESLIRLTHCAGQQVQIGNDVIIPTDAPYEVIQLISGNLRKNYILQYGVEAIAFIEPILGWYEAIPIARALVSYADTIDEWLDLRDTRYKSLVWATELIDTHGMKIPPVDNTPVLASGSDMLRFIKTYYPLVWFLLPRDVYKRVCQLYIISHDATVMAEYGCELDQIQDVTKNIPIEAYGLIVANYIKKNRQNELDQFLSEREEMVSDVLFYTCKYIQVNCSSHLRALLAYTDRMNGSTRQFLAEKIANYIESHSDVLPIKCLIDVIGSQSSAINM